MFRTGICDADKKHKEYRQRDHPCDTELYHQWNGQGDPLKLSVVEMVKTGTTLTAQKVFFKDQPNKDAPLTGYVWGSAYKTINDNQETVYKNIPLVLAKKTAAAKIVLNTTDSDAEGHAL